MNKRRLKEIKDSIDLQYELWKECENTILIDEEKELYNEVIKLHKIINELESYLKYNIETENPFYIKDTFEIVLNRLQELKGDSSNE